MPATPTARRPVAPAALAAVVAALLYAVTLAGTYVYDDVPVVRDDPRVHSVAVWGQLWTGDYFDGGSDRLYRPLVSTSYAVQWWLHGDRPWAFHLVNVLLHATVAAGVAELARRATGSTPAAASAGLIFAAMPCHVEAVANIVGRAELAAAAGLVWSLVLLARRPLTVGRAAGVLALGVVALLSKEQGLLAPLLWAAFWLTRIPRGWRLQPPSTAGSERGPRLLLITATYGWAGYVVVREFVLKLKFDWDRSAMDWTMQPLIRSAGLDRGLMPFDLLGRYAMLILWPAHTSPDYGADAIGSVARRTDPYLWVGFAVAAAWTIAVAAACRRRAGFAAFCLFASAAAYGLVGNAVTLIGTIFGERLLYLPSAFVALLAGVALARCPRLPRLAIVGSLTVAFGIQAVRWSLWWNRPLDLYTVALAYQPESVQLHFLRAEQLRHAGRGAEADAVLADATARYPDYWRAWMFRGLGSADAGDFAAADADLTRADRLSSNPSIRAARERVDALRHQK